MSLSPPKSERRNALKIEGRAFLDELQKIASAWEDTKSWVKQNPGLTAAAAGGLVGGGMLARHLTRRAAPGQTQVVRDLQARARKHGIRPTVQSDYMTRAAKPTIRERIKARIQAGGFKPLMTDDQGYLLHKQRPGKAVTLGLDKDTASKAEILFGGKGTKSVAGKKIEETAHKLDVGGKVKEVSDEVGVGKLFAPKNLSGGDIIAKHKIRPPGESMRSKQRYLSQLQDAMEAEYGASKRGYLLKPHGEVSSGGAFPTHQDDWAAAYKDYIHRLKPEIEALKRDIRRRPEEYGGDAPSNIIADYFRDDPAFIGMALEQSFKRPKKMLAQRMLPLVRTEAGPVEFRVHSVGGEVPKQLSYLRYGKQGDKAFKGIPDEVMGTPQEAAEWVRKEVMPRLAEKHRAGTFGMDVIRVRKPDGGYGFKLVELNPSSRGGASGFLDTGLNPNVAQDMSQWLLGRDAPLRAAKKIVGGSGLAAGATGGGAYLAGRE